MFVCGMGTTCQYFTSCKAKHEVKRPCGRSNPSLGDYEETIQQPPKPPRKRSAPLYGELLNERERLAIDNHNMRVCLDLIKNATLFGVLLWWFRNRKGGGK